MLNPRYVCFDLAFSIRGADEPEGKAEDGREAPDQLRWRNADWQTTDLRDGSGRVRGCVKSSSTSAMEAACIWKARLCQSSSVSEASCRDRHTWKS